METRYKFLQLTGDCIRSQADQGAWIPGEWRSFADDEEITLCEWGFHCSKTAYQAFTFVQGEILAEVEVEGHSAIDTDKEAWQKMRLVRCLHWRQVDSVALAIYAAELALENFEKVFPNDLRPRQAIEAAKTWLAEPTEKNQSAAWSAAESARSAARSARSAAGSAAASARSAAESAAASARSAARSARSAARSAAESAAESAAWSAIIEKVTAWMAARAVTLDVYVPEGSSIV